MLSLPSSVSFPMQAEQCGLLTDFSSNNYSPSAEAQGVSPFFIHATFCLPTTGHPPYCPQYIFSTHSRHCILSAHCLFHILCQLSNRVSLVFPTNKILIARMKHPTMFILATVKILWAVHQASPISTSCIIHVPLRGPSINITQTAQT